MSPDSPSSVLVGNGLITGMSREEEGEAGS